MATWQVSDLTYADFLEIINDPEAYLEYKYGFTEWIPWTGEFYDTNFTQTVQLRYVGLGDEPYLPPLPFPEGLNLHMQFALGFDHFKITPNIAESAFSAAAWATCVKPGRYGNGLCVRLDSHDYFLESVPTYFDIAVPGPGYFLPGDTMVQWAGNRLTYGGVDYPNGYDVILPFTQRAHIYQPAGQTWVLDTFYNYAGAQYQYLLMEDGVLWGINNVSHLLAPNAGAGDVVIAAIPNTVGEWYDLELIQTPDVALTHSGAPAVNPATPGVNITFSVKVNGVTYYTDAGVSVEPANFGQHQLGYVRNKGGTFIDNYYGVFMTIEGLPLLADAKWIINSVEPVADACVGAWTGVDFETNTKFRSDYTTTIQMGTDDYLIQEVNNIVYNVNTVADGLYTKFHYSTPLPLPGTPVATYAVVLGDSFSPYGYPWMLQGRKAALTLRDINFPNLGVDNNTRYTHNDLYSASSAGRTHNQFLATPNSKGVVQIGVDIKNYVTV